MTTPAKYYVLFCLTSYKSVDEAKAKDPQSLAAHMVRSRELHAKGKVIMAGAFLDNLDGALSTMAVFSSRQDAEEYAKGDPFILNGTVTKWFIREWANILR